MCTYDACRRDDGSATGPFPEATTTIGQRLLAEEPVHLKRCRTPRWTRCRSPAAIEIFFGDLRLAPRSRKTYRQGSRSSSITSRRMRASIRRRAPVTTLTTDHVTSFAALLVPPGHPDAGRGVADADRPEQPGGGPQVLFLHFGLRPASRSLDRSAQVRIAAMMPRFTPPPPDVKLPTSSGSSRSCRTGPREEKPHLELRRLKVRAMILFMFRTGVRVSELCACGGGIWTSKRARPGFTGRRAARAEPCISMSIPPGRCSPTGAAGRRRCAGPGHSRPSSGRDKVGAPGQCDQSPHGRAHRGRDLQG